LYSRRAPAGPETAGLHFSPGFVARAAKRKYPLG